MSPDHGQRAAPMKQGRSFAYQEETGPAPVKGYHLFIAMAA